MELQVSPVHINYINEDSEASGYSDVGWRSVPLFSSSRNRNPNQRNSFTLPFDYLDEADEGNFIIPDPVYADDAYYNMADVSKTSMSSVAAQPDQGSRKRRKRYKDHRRSRHSIENETLLMQEMVYDDSKGARPKVYYSRKNFPETANGE